MCHHVLYIKYTALSGPLQVELKREYSSSYLDFLRGIDDVVCSEIYHLTELELSTYLFHLKYLFSGKVGTR